ncbi:branched-chain amino acid ABC transporter permease [Pararobbsia alpina]|uniref:High-affinity branched-chain amino acid transport system permease protein LivH n=1 Tax=Pararobbsia alpina TaxID=621374 RepID=A0A6S7C1I8_9BURK|nr:branched-chain amino acid ABC transporter permease [Pararobbsia alpina]CAB3799269.1 High-affinity branched-chain amino acid transport system permease protein LivH [Pararobbsia alpina]
MSWVNQILQGVLLGGFYALLACGVSFMFGVMRIINLAHGSLAVVAAYGVFWLAERYDMNPFVGLAIAIPAMAVLGWLLHRLILERSARAGELVPILATFGLAVVLDNSLFVTFGADTRSLAPYIDTLAYDGIDIAGMNFGHLSLLTFGVAVVLLGGLQLMLKHTSMGRKIRAVADDASTAQLVGVNAFAVNAFASAIAMGTVAIAGAFLALRATVDPYAGGPQLIFAFEAVMIGGIGSLWGTLGGGIALGVAQSLGAKVHSQGFLIAGHVLFLLVLFARLVRDGRPLRSLFIRFR